MAEYIDREAAVLALAEQDFDYDKAKQALAGVPAADVAPVVHAEWEPLWFDDEDRLLGEPPSDYMCSKCKIISADNSDYCPHCGVRMDGGSHDEL